MFWVYILENSLGKFYIGQTLDLPTRLEHHNKTDRFEGAFHKEEWSMEISLVGAT